MELGKRVKARREELGITQEELAKKMGYRSRSSINKIELGVNDISQSKIQQLADALQTTPAYLMGWDELQKLAEEGYRLFEESVRSVFPNGGEDCFKCDDTNGKWYCILNGDEVDVIVRYKALDERGKKATKTIIKNEWENLYGTKE